MIYFEIFVSPLSTIPICPPEAEFQTSQYPVLVQKCKSCSGVYSPFCFDGQVNIFGKGIESQKVTVTH